MTKEIEMEFKNLLTKEEFYRLLKSFHITEKDFSIQKNHYFDTSHFSLKKEAAALRIRELAHRNELTLKKKIEHGVLEINQKIEDKDMKLLIKDSILPEGEVKEAITQIGIPIRDLFHFGSLTTHRAEQEYRGGLLVFDHSFYMDKEDFELEYEVSKWETGKMIFMNLLHQLQIKPKSTDTKIGRLYRARFRNNQ
ncbi:CYTH domain-containing protein [Lederbergia sp. NSJ-179]|uniref:CYTH domain-containing protein n=1 Tax=Lederbergia sp. NSJ-179 TaxID=2931402 RepID=UPI001FD0B21D|nr:CYTH domain-containing protein [Lederbergia sp. NSJ-179]MCJ7840354.1 CYTH domain-containing protein [Lederbergia sp. NSJ-179]